MMKNRHSTIRHLLFLCSLLAANVLLNIAYANTTQEAYHLIAEAQKTKKTNPAKSLNLADKALVISIENNDISLQKNALFTIGLTYKTNKQYKKAKEILLKALNLPTNTQKNKSVSTQILMNLGDTHRFLNDIPTAITYAEEAINTAKEIENIGLLINAYNILGNIYKTNQQFDKAIDNYKASIHHAIDGSHAEELSKSYRNIAKVYKRLRDYHTAINYYLKAINIITDSPTFGELASQYNGLAECYQKIGKDDLSLKYKQKSLEVTEKSGNTKKILKIYRELATYYSHQEDYEASIGINQKGLGLVERRGDLQEIAMYLEYIAIDQRKLGHYTEALKNAKRALAVQRSLEDNDRVANLLLNISIIYRRLSSYDEALEYAIELIDIRENEKNANGMAAAYNATGLIYQNLMRPNEASRYYEQTLGLPEEEIEAKYRAAALRALAGVFQNDGLYDDALRYAEEAKSLYEKIPSIAGAESVNRTIGLIYKEVGNNAKALQALQLALSQARELKDTWSEANSLIKIGEISVETDPRGAKKSAEKGLKLLRPLAAKSLITDAYDVLMKSEESIGNYRKAYSYAKKQYRLTREISEDEMTQRVAELRIVRETEKREREIDALKKEAQIKELELNRTSSELEILNSKNIISNLQLEQERYARFSLMGLTLVIFLALAMLYNRYRYSRQRQDILNEKSLQIESKNTKLEELNATKDRFFSIIAHDLRGPISSLVSLSEMLDAHFSSYTQDELRSYIHAIHNSSAQTYSLLDELLEWAMMQLKNTDPIPRVHCAAEICDSVATTLAPLAQSKNIHITNNVIDQLPVYADRNMINTIVRNLIANALKFTPHNGTIEIFAESDANYTTIHVKDSGIGINEDELADLFRIDKNVSRKGTDGEAGTGFGLILCKDLVKKNGGEIFVSSKRNEGSDFYFQIPQKK